MSRIDLIEEEAGTELANEPRRAAIDAAKVRIRERRNRPWWRELFPYRVHIERLP